MGECQGDVEAGEVLRPLLDLLHVLALLLVHAMLRLEERRAAQLTLRLGA